MMCLKKRGTKMYEVKRSEVKWSEINLQPHGRMDAYDIPLSVGFSRQEYWNGLPFPSPGDFPDPGIEPSSPALAGGFFTIEPPGKPRCSLQSNLFWHNLTSGSTEK